MDKKSERARVLKERNALSPTKRAELNSALCRFLGSFLDTVEVQTIGAFLPIGSEPDISQVLKRWLSADSNREVFLPVTEGKIMRFAFWDTARPLKIGRFNVPEPTSDIYFEPPLLLVPCIAINKGGYRLGYGAGYYDRYLPQTRCPAMLLCRHQLEREDIPMEPHDVLMDYFVTERGVVDCKAERGA